MNRYDSAVGHAGIVQRILWTDASVHYKTEAGMQELLFACLLFFADECAYDPFALQDTQYLRPSTL